MTTAGWARARANANIAFIKYWGNADDRLRLPVNSSLSMNLDGLYTETTVRWDERLSGDELILNGANANENALQRVSRHLDVIRERINLKAHAAVESRNNFPMGAGIASSAASFAALTVAACAAAHADISERELTTLARMGSGSASRSVPDGFVEWHQGTRHDDSYAESIAPHDYWDVVDIVAVVSSAHKQVGSSQGHVSAKTSDLQDARVAGAAKRLEQCKRAILERDFASFADVVEYDSNLMHAVMMTSRPPLFYWQPATLTVMEQVRQWRADGVTVCYTLDAGPNVHCICLRESAAVVSNGLRALSGVEDVREAGVGGAAYVLETDVSNS